MMVLSNISMINKQEQYHHSDTDTLQRYSYCTAEWAICQTKVHKHGFGNTFLILVIEQH